MPEARLKRTRDLGGPWDPQDGGMGRAIMAIGEDAMARMTAVLPMRVGFHVLRYDIQSDMMLCLRCGCSYSSPDVAGQDECRWWVIDTHRADR